MSRKLVTISLLLCCGATVLVFILDLEFRCLPKCFDHEQFPNTTGCNFLSVENVSLVVNSRQFFRRIRRIFTGARRRFLERIFENIFVWSNATGSFGLRCFCVVRKTDFMSRKEDNDNNDFNFILIIKNTSMEVFSKY